MDTEALEAAKRGNLPKLHDRLDAGVNVNARDAKGQTLLHHAAINGQRMVAQWLLHYVGADVLITDNDDRTALHAAMARFDDALVNAMLENVSREKLRKLLNAKSKGTGSAALHLAAKADCYMDASYLLEYGANFEIRNGEGKKPVELASGEEMRELLRTIDECFAKARKGDARLMDDLKESDAPSDIYITPMLNCRDNEGHTLLQVLILRGHVDLALDLLHWRVNYPIDRDLLALYDPKRQTEVDAVAELTRECHEFGLECEKEIMKTIRSSHLSQREFESRVGKVACRSLEKVHEVMLAFRKFEGERKSASANPKLRTLEQVFEVMGFDLERPESVCYYKKLPTQWKSNKLTSFLLLVDMIHNAIEYLLFWIDRLRVFRAVLDDDVEKVQRLVKSGAKVYCIDQTGRTVLCHAVEAGSRKMVKLLLKLDAKMTYDSVVSANGWDIANAWKTSFYVAVNRGHAKIVKLLLKKGGVNDLAELFEYRHENESTVMHAAAKVGQLDMVKTLLSYGAVYGVLDADGHKPLDVSGNEDVRKFLEVVEECFCNAKDAKLELISKLKAMSMDDFMAVAGTKNEEGQTLAVVAMKAKAKSIAEVVLRMVREVKGNEK